MKQQVIAMMPRILAIVAVVVILGAALSAGSALAAKGGIKGKPGGNGNGGKGDSYAATLTVSPDPVPAFGAEFTVTGSGFKTDRWVYFSTTCNGSFNMWVDGNGGVSFVETSRFPGTCKYDAYQYSGRKLVLMATVTFEVV